MNTFIKAKDGYKFIPTGKADGRIKAKFNPGVASKGDVERYSHACPVKWVRNEFVVEVKE